jgi:Homing endonuclease associated repeat
MKPVGETVMLTCRGCGEPFEGVVKRGHVREWCSERCRKAQYDKQCSDCGARIDGTTPGRSTGRCAVCAKTAFSAGVREGHLGAIREWAAIHGEPPARADWDAYQCRFVGDEARAQRAEAALAEGWPSSNTIIKAFGSWNEAIRAAGFEPRAPGGDAANHRRSRRARGRQP